MPGHLFVVDGDITRLRCDAWLLPTSRNWSITKIWGNVPGVGAGGIYPNRPDSWPETGVFLHQEGEDGEPDIWLGDIGRSALEDSGHYGDRAKSFAREAVARIRDKRAAELALRGRRPVIAFNVLGSGHGGKRWLRGQLINELLPALVDITDEEVDVVLVCYGPVMYSAVQATRRKLFGEVDHSPVWSTLDETMRGKAVDLAALAQRGQLVLFMGAGISTDSGIPAWQGLLQEIATEVGLSPQEVDELSRFDPRDQASILQERYSGKISDLVASRMRVERYGLVHGLLASLPVRETVTTNFDQLFESASTASGAELSILPGDDVTYGKRWLLKLHGDIGGDLVFTRSDYMGAMSSHSALRGIVQAMLMTRHMLFVGYALRDDDFHQLVHEVRFARGDNRNNFGTALVLESSGLTESLWKEITFVATAKSDRPSAEDYPRQRSWTYEAARQLWIFLDLVGMLASSEIMYVTDQSFGELKGHEEARLSELINELRQLASATGSSWPELTAFLERFTNPVDEDY